MLSSIQKLLSPNPPPAESGNTHPTIKKNKPLRTSYSSLPVAIPDDFTSSTPAPDSLGPIVYSPIDWADTPIPENKGRYAVILDNVLSPSECSTLISLAEQSVPLDNPNMRGGDGGPWMPALVNVGSGYEVLTPDYRRSARIVWDSREIAGRLWKRIETVPEVKERLARVGASEARVAGRARDWEVGGSWEFDRVNERLRFLRYGAGDFFRRKYFFARFRYLFLENEIFVCDDYKWLMVKKKKKAHCDSPYAEKDDREEGGVLKTLFTVHLYLNDSKAEVGDEAELVGGATTLFSSDEKRRFDVNPKAGRVLIFQHAGVLHSGDDVKSGVKYSVRSDIVYRFVKKDKKEEA